MAASASTQATKPQPPDEEKMPLNPTGDTSTNIGGTKPTGTPEGQGGNAAGNGISKTGGLEAGQPDSKDDKIPHVQKEGVYNPTAHGGQFAATYGGLLSLVTLLKQTVLAPETPFTRALKGLLITSIVISVVLLMLQGVATALATTKTGPIQAWINVINTGLTMILAIFSVIINGLGTGTFKATLDGIPGIGSTK